jgi:Heterokaryon incompatibility protein (HET)
MEFAATGDGKALCDDCSNILAPENLQGRYPVYVGISPISPIQVLRTRVEEGCLICGMVFRELLKHAPDSIELGVGIGIHALTLNIRVFEVRNGSREGLSNRYLLEYSLYHDGHFYDVQIHLVPAAGESTSTQHLPNILSLFCIAGAHSSEDGSGHADSSTGSEASWLRRVAWLSHCVTSHNWCNMGGSPWSAAPTRFIDVGSETQEPRLCYSADVETAKPKYVTLSHCWGSLPLPKLTASTHNGLVNGIDIETLPATFQEAIQFTRRLRAPFGVSYLWIDALCIFQDSPDDWRHEGALMSDIYANAWCNLSATNARDGRDGLFSKRDPVQTISVLERDIASGLTTPFVIFPSSVWDPVATSHLTKRAWVHQERTLSRRILHFTKEEIFWECQQHSASESVFSGEFSDYVKNIDLERVLLDPVVELQWPEGVLQGIWSSCVANFSKGSLSRAEDKLLAIAGLATRVHQRSPGVEYLAGLWGYEVEKQLLWRRNEEIMYSHRDVYRAPSWSWASIDGEICLSWHKHYVGYSRFGSFYGPEVDFRDAEPVAKFKEANIETVAEDRFGQVKAGSLRLEGKIWKGADLWRYDLNPLQGGTRVQDVGEAMAGPDIRYAAKFSFSDTKLDVYLDALISLEQPCYLFPLFIVSTGSIAGLLLQHSGQARGCFRRIGLFDTPSKQSLFWLHAPFNTLPEWDYEEKIQGDKYVISII